MISVDDVERIRAKIAEKYKQDPIQLIEDARSERNILPGNRYVRVFCVYEMPFQH